MEKNYMTLTFKSLSENESFARSVISCFALKLNPTLSEISDIKTAVSEAVTNCIVHGYSKGEGEIRILAEIENKTLHINVSDDGVGIENIDKAIEPFYTTKPDDERSGMGFIIRKRFMDEIKVTSKKGSGTNVYMKKIIKTDNL